MQWPAEIRARLRTTGHQGASGNEVKMRGKVPRPRKRISVCWVLACALSPLATSQRNAGSQGNGGVTVQGTVWEESLSEPTLPAGCILKASSEGNSTLWVPWTRGQESPVLLWERDPLAGSMAPRLDTVGVRETNGRSVWLARECVFVPCSSVSLLSQSLKDMNTVPEITRLAKPPGVHLGA